MKDKKIYFNIILTVVISYILIKFIDNYHYFFGLVKLLFSLLTPFVIAFILAYILSPIVNLLERTLKTKRIVSLLITYGFFIALIGASLVYTVPIIIANVSEIINQLPDYAIQTQDFLFKLGDSLKNVDPNTLKDIGDKIMSAIPDISNLLIGSLGNIFNTTFSIGKFIIQFVLAIVICFYILLEKEKFLSFSKKSVYVLLGRKFARLLLEVCSILNTNIGKYFSSKILDSAIVGVLSAIGLYFIGARYALLFGTLIGFMNLIPYIGPFLSMGGAALLNLFYSPKIALFSLIYLFIVQQVEVAVIEPKIVGGQLDMSPFLTILAVTIGGGLFGIPGMILSVPVLGVIKIYINKYIEAKSKNFEEFN
ncbi:MAG: AI-2E family transporter [Romboutsia sp.]|nr:AI-2E family transporter [Romboutsia sp.]